MTLLLEGIPSDHLLLLLAVLVINVIDSPCFFFSPKLTFSIFSLFSFLGLVCVLGCLAPFAFVVIPVEFCDQTV